MWIAVISLTLGFVALVWGADLFLSGAAATARNFGVSKLLIGLTIVSLGTSAPEILVAALATSNGKPLLAIGNAIGSNITNIGLVLGCAAALAPLPFKRSLLKGELPWLMGATVAALLIALDQRFSFLESLLLLVLLGVFTHQIWRRNRTCDTALPLECGELNDIPQLSRARAGCWLAFGLLLLLGSAEVIVWAAIDIAQSLGVSELLIGLTIVALGTSLPELATTLTAVRQGQTDIAIGNVVGSNILNILAVMPIPGLIAPVTFGGALLWRDLSMLLVMTLLLFLFAYGFNNARPVITRFEGMILLTAWIGYNVLLYMQA